MTFRREEYQKYVGVLTQKLTLLILDNEPVKGEKILGVNDANSWHGIIQEFRNLGILKVKKGICTGPLRKYF